ncbi:hypothetical protein FOZ63_010814, partial [Perkinsus olseni]
HIETRSISWRPSGNQGVIQYIPETRKIDVMAIDETWMDILTDLVSDSSSELKARRIEPSEAGSSIGAALSESERPALSQDEGLFEILEVLEDYDKTSDDEVGEEVIDHGEVMLLARYGVQVELKAGELVRVEEVDPSGWIKVRKADGTLGWTSESFLGNPSPSRMDQQE